MSSKMLEIVNGTWFALGLCLLVIFGRLLALDIWRTWPNLAALRRREDTRALFAVLVYFAGVCIVRGWTWWWTARTHLRWRHVRGDRRLLRL